MRNALVLAATVVVIVGAAPAFVSAQESYVSITDVSVAPSEPAPGETITITPTVRNLPGSPSRFEFTAVALRSGPSQRLEEHGRVRDLGTLAPDSTLEVPLTVTFDDPGTRNLRVHVYGRDKNGNSVHVQYPVVVRVGETHPQLDIGTNETVASQPGEGELTVANGLESRVRNVEVTLGSPTLDLDNSRLVLPGMDAGESVEAGFGFEASEPGTHRVTATLRYTVAGGHTRTVSESVRLTVDPLVESVAIEATRSPQDGSVVVVDVLNRGNVGIENVTLRAESPDATVPRRLVAEVPAQSSRTVRLNASLGAERATVDVEATYDVGDGGGTAVDSADLVSTPGRIELTGINVEPEGNRLHVTGSASNVGLTGASSVVVRVPETDRVSPAYPVREFFVGSVPASDFASFDVYASVEGNVTEIPLEVAYLVDGERFRRTVAVPYEGGAPGPALERPRRSGGGGGDGLLVPAVVGAVVFLVVIALVVVAWRNSRGGP